MFLFLFCFLAFAFNSLTLTAARLVYRTSHPILPQRRWRTAPPRGNQESSRESNKGLLHHGDAPSRQGKHWRQGGQCGSCPPSETWWELHWSKHDLCPSLVHCSLNVNRYTEVRKPGPVFFSYLQNFSQPFGLQVTCDKASLHSEAVVLHR